MKEQFISLCLLVSVHQIVKVKSVATLAKYEFIKTSLPSLFSIAK